MPKFCISVVNRTFEASEEQDFPTLEVAQAQAIKSALSIGVAEVGENTPLFAAEVKIDRDGEQLARYFVSVGVSPLR
jgi:hypothetical protein